MQRKRPLRGKICARCIPKRLFAGLFGCMARISCQREPVFGYMARESCREGALFPPEATFGMHGTQNLPRIAARECTVATSCHGSPFKNASRRHLAEKALGCPGLLRNRSGVRESEDVARTKRLPIQQRTPTRPRNHENILVPFTKKRHRKRTRVVWRT